MAVTFEITVVRTLPIYKSRESEHQLQVKCFCISLRSAKAPVRGGKVK